MPLTWTRKTAHRYETADGRGIVLVSQILGRADCTIYIDKRHRGSAPTLAAAKAQAERWLAPDPPDLSQPPARCEGRDFAAWEND